MADLSATPHVPSHRYPLRTAAVFTLGLLTVYKVLTIWVLFSLSRHGGGRGPDALAIEFFVIAAVLAVTLVLDAVSLWSLTGGWFRRRWWNAGLIVTLVVYGVTPLLWLFLTYVVTLASGLTTGGSPGAVRPMLIFLVLLPVLLVGILTALLIPVIGSAEADQSGVLLRHREEQSRNAAQA